MKFFDWWEIFITWSFYNCFVDVITDLNKEELISGLLLPCPPLAVPCSGSFCSLYNKPDVLADKGELPASFFTEVHTSSKGFDAGDRLSVSPQLPVNDVEGASNGVYSDDALLLLDQRFAKLSNASPEPAPLLENFQRSKSRQRALALRNSAELFGSNLQDENGAGVLDGEIAGSEIATLQLDHVQDLELVESVHISKESCKVEEAKLSEFHGMENGMVLLSVLCFQFCILNPFFNCIFHAFESTISKGFCS